MKNIKINFCGFWKGFQKENNFIIEILEKKYDIEISEAPDYLFCSCFGSFLEFTKYRSCIRIYYSGENVSPDFNLVDYAIGYDRLQYGDRFLSYKFGYPNKNGQKLNEAHKHVSTATLSKKSRFCNFIYSHPTPKQERENFLNALNLYKKVDCAGSFLNNMPDSWVASSYELKEQFQNTCKFSIAFESTSLPGFHTEKIRHAFETNTIPIYYGDPCIAEIFNSKAFINVHEFTSFEQVIEKVREIDQDDSLYLSILKEAPLLDEAYPLEQYRKLEGFLFHILEQPLESAIRRSTCYAAAEYEEHMENLNLILNYRGRLFKCMLSHVFKSANILRKN